MVNGDQQSGITSIMITIVTDFDIIQCNGYFKH